MKILLTGDWQSQTSNLDLSRRALEKELELIKKHKIDVHIDLGDSKEEYSPVAVGVTNFQVERSRKIAKALGKVHCFRLLGNHDRIGQHSDSRNWLTVFSDHCTCITEPLATSLYNIDLMFLPYGKDVKATIYAASKLAKKVLGSKGVLFFHCDVNGAQYSNVRKATSESKLTVDTLQHKVYKQCFGGHIHKRQTLAGNVHYIGNPFPTDMGEVNQEKGFTIYDTDKGTITFISSELPLIYTFDYLSKKQIKKVPDGTQIKHVVTVNANEDYYDVLDKANQVIEKKYPNSIPFVVPEFEEGLAPIDEAAKLDIDATEIEQIKGYLDIVKTDPKYRPAVEAYMKYVLSVVSKKVSYGKGITAEEVEASNILSFKKVKFSFRKRGVCLIRGKNKDWPGHSIGAGKSNLLALLPIAHSGKTFKDQKFGEIVNDYTPDEKAWVRLKYTTRSNDKLEIYRQFNPSKLVFTVNGKDASQGMRSNGKKDTQGLIEELTGYTFNTLANAVYIDQSMTQSFLLGTDKDRAELLHKFQNLDRFVIAQKIANVQLSVLKRLVEDIEIEQDSKEMLIKETKDRLLELKEVQKNHLGKLKKEWQVASDAYKALKLKVAPYIDRHVKSISSINKLVVEKQFIVDALNTKLVGLQFKKQTTENLLHRMERATKGHECSVCFQPITIDRKKKIVGNLEQKIKMLRLKVGQLAVKLSNMESTIGKSTTEIEVLDNTIEKYAGQLRELASKVKAAYAFYKNEKETMSTDSVQALQTKIVVLKQARKTLEELRVYHLETTIIVAKASKGFGRDGLPLFLNKMMCPRLNAAASYYSDLFVDKEIQVLFKISDSHQLIPKIVNAHGGKNLSGQSQGEKAWGGIITAFAIRDIAQPINLLILDEPGAGLDSEAAKQLGARLNKLSKKFETLLVVTHNPYIESALAGSNTVTVVKKHKTSKIYEAN